MSTGIVGFIIGVFVGGSFGVMMLAILIAGEDRK